MILRNLFILSLFVCSSFVSFAQEFKTKVTISTPKLQSADPKIFKTLESQLIQFLNDRKWTDNTYELDERIELNIQIVIDQEISSTRFKGQMTLQAIRPVYNSTYNTVLLELQDKEFEFNYQEFEALDFSETVYFSNLCSMLGFYAYVVLGLDSDSYAELGGDQYFLKAQQVLNNLPSNVVDGFPGWKQFGTTRNRFWLIENILAVRMKTFRSAWYAYHLLGLDAMVDKPTQGQAAIKTAIEEFKKANNDYPTTMLIQLFCIAKRDEIIDIFKVTDQPTKTAVFDAMSRMDGTQVEKYRLGLMMN
jgi:Domain of unknown function (DUF4835)